MSSSPASNNTNTTFITYNNPAEFRNNNTTFITYNHPAEFRSRQNRRAVSSHASKSYRPTARRIVLDRTQYRPFEKSRRLDDELSSISLARRGHGRGLGSRTNPDADADAAAKEIPVDNTTAKHLQGSRTTRPRVKKACRDEQNPLRDVQPLDERALGSPHVDPFISYPIEYHPYVPFLVDYFIRFLTPRFSPALAVESSRYIIWFNVALQHSGMFHALVALSQVYYNIDVTGFGKPHCTALYHRGEALKFLRLKVETAQCADDDAAILTALWLMDVDAAHGDLRAYAMHKRAKENMVFTRGGIRRLNPELQDELLKSEFFLPLLLHGRFVCEVTEDDVLVRFKENEPVQPSQTQGFDPLFSDLASRGLITAQAVDILQRLSQEIWPADKLDGEAVKSSCEMSRVLRITDEGRPKTPRHRLLLALLIYIFNLHNQTQLPLAPPTVGTPTPTNTVPACHPYMEILSDVALELSSPIQAGDPTSANEREVTLWTVVAIGSASSFSPWRVEIPFMGHLIEWMEKDEEEHVENTDPALHEALSSVTPTGSRRKKSTNLDKLTACLRGYYLYGADKQTLRSLQSWEGPVVPG